jgi:polygalacturonase
VGRPCENITVTNCTMLDGHGGVVIGSEMSGGVRRVTISNCVFEGTDRGIRIKTTRGRGGAIEDIRVSNVVMTRIAAAPFDLNMFYQKMPEEPVSERTPILRNLHFSGITIKNSPAAGFILGLPEMPVDNVTFSNLSIEAEKGFSCSNAKNIAFRNVRINTKKGPALIGENMQDLEIEGFRTLTPHEDCAVIDLKNAAGVYVHGCGAISGTATFLSLRGETTRGILMQANDLRNASSPVKTTEECPASAVVQN